MGKFTDKGIKALTKPGRHPDGDGLYLYVAPGGTKSWVQRIVVNGKRRDIGLGSYPTVSLAQARLLGADNRAAVSEGRDPLAERHEAKEAARNPAASVPTFAEAASRVIELRRRTWSNPKHAAQWQSTLRTYAFPVIGNKAVDEITPVRCPGGARTHLDGQERNGQQGQAAHRDRDGLGDPTWPLHLQSGRQGFAYGAAARQAGRETPPRPAI